MTISTTDLEKIARLAYLDINTASSAQLSQEISSIMDFVDQLRSIDTSQVAPLFHPFALHQRLRSDSVTEEDCIAELEEIAPMFEDNLYLVPKVLESGK
jgi:aspartyl-tRNA(Asn)/glutamyl-tRNA(Gln) amidotransferase subunit C